LAPTPHHTPEMVDTLIEDMLDVWIKLGIPLNAVRNQNYSCKKKIFHYNIVYLFKNGLLFVDFTDSLQYVQEKTSVCPNQQPYTKQL